MHMNLGLFIIKIVCVVILVALLCLLVMFFIAFGGMTALVTVPKPEITYGEFPIRLEYEVDGVVKVVKDTIICEFDGFCVEGENGKYRKWKTYLKSGNERLVLLDLRELEEKNEFGQRIVEFYFYYGNGEYYMDDEFDHRKRERQDLNHVSYLYQANDGTMGGSSYTADEAYDKYKIRLINCDSSLPIENNFK